MAVAGYTAILDACVLYLAASDPKGAERLWASSTHWLRHTHGTHAVAAGMPLDVAQQNLGHASLDTTAGYTTSEERRCMVEGMKFWERQRDRHWD